MARGPGLCPVLFPKALSPMGHSPLPCPSPSPFQPHRLGSSALPNPAPQGPGPYPSWFYTTLTYLYSPTTRKRYQVAPSTHRDLVSTSHGQGGWKVLTKHLVPLYRQGN